MCREQEETIVKAKIEVAVARAKEELAAQKARAAAGAKAVADNAKLLKSGITAGVSAGLQFPLGARKGTSLQLAAFVAMPYVVFLPGYWGGTEARREYCASEWGGGSESDAAAAAMEIARRKASNKFEAFVSAMNVEATDEQILAWEDSRAQAASAKYGSAEADFETASKKFKESDKNLTEKLQALQAASGKEDAQASPVTIALREVEEARKNFLASQEKYYAAAALYLKSRSPDPMATIVARTRIWRDDSGGDPQRREARKADIIRWLAEQDWNSTLRGKCWGMKFGAFLGKPLGHEVRAKVRGLGLETRDFSSQLAFGATFTPNAYVSVLAGVTVGEVKRQGVEGTPRDPRTVWAGNVSLGGNFDLAAALIKGAQSIP